MRGGGFSTCQSNPRSHTTPKRVWEALTVTTRAKAPSGDTARGWIVKTNDGNLFLNDMYCFQLVMMRNSTYSRMKQVPMCKYQYHHHQHHHNHHHDRLHRCRRHHHHHPPLKLSETMKSQCAQVALRSNRAPKGPGRSLRRLDKG